MKRRQGFIGVAAGVALAALLWPSGPETSRWGRSLTPQPSQVVGTGFHLTPSSGIESSRGVLQERPPRPISKFASLPRPDPRHESKFARFLQWLEEYETADVGQRNQMEDAGVGLAQRRREEMLELIPSDPKRALELSIPRWFRDSLPESVTGLLETPFNARGHLMVRAALPLPGEEEDVPRVERILELGEETYRAYTYGRRLGESSRSDVGLHGVLLEGIAAVHERTVRVATREETAFRLAGQSRDPVCTVSGQAAAAADAVLVEHEGEESFVCGTPHAEDWESALIAESSNRFGRASEGPVLSASTYTEGLKSLVLIRVDFEDKAGIPFSDTQAETLVSGLQNFFDENSFGRAGFRKLGDGSEVTPTLRMPRTSAWYGTNDASRLRSDARTAARAAGYDLTQFNFDVIWFKKVSGFKWAGLGYVGSPGAWVQDTASVGVTAHELGHNFGLEHANFWDTSGESVIGPGTMVEYGDKFDTMGSANAGSKHFNARYKSQLNWIPTSDVTVPASNGVYRLFPHDDPASSGPRAIRIRKNSSTNYWVELRQRYTGNKWLADGVTLRWAGTGSQATRLLDMTPGTVPGKDDAALLLGRTFSDWKANLHLTPVAKHPTTPPSMDILVQIGPFPENRTPSVSLSAPVVQASAGSELRFTALASDPDGDALSFFWDFGDSEFQGQGPTANHRWATGGEYTVRCEVSDGKGGRASAHVVVRIGNPSTFRISGRVLTTEGLPVEGVRMAASSTQMTWTDSAGNYVLTGLVGGTYSLKAVLADYAFQPASSGTIVSVGPSRQQVDFVAAPPSGVLTEPIVTAGSVWQFLDDGTSLGTAWRERSFDDSSWKEGAAPLGYGDDNERTAVGFGPNSNSKFVTTYFRRVFQVGAEKAYSAATLGVRRDDGAVVYLDGREIFRNNMPSGTITNTTLATGTVSGSDEQAFFNVSVNPNLLSPGEHVLAVEIHQSSRSSSDIVFDLELLGSVVPMPAPPILTVERAGEELRLSWPDGPRAWQLQETERLEPTATWSAFELTPSAVGGRRILLIPMREQARFFRLSDKAAARSLEER